MSEGAIWVLHTEGPTDFTGEENYFYDQEADVGWVLSWDIPESLHD